MKRWLIPLVLLGALAAWPMGSAQAHPRRCSRSSAGYRSYGYRPIRSYSSYRYGFGAPVYRSYGFYGAPRFGYGYGGYGGYGYGGYGYGGYGYGRGIDVYFGGW